MLGLSKHGSNINGVIHFGLKPSVKTCGNTHGETNTQAGSGQIGPVCSEGRTGPFVETKLRASGEYRVSEGMSLCGKCQRKRWGHFFFSTFPVWHLLHNGPFNSRWCLGIFRWGQFERLCWHSRYNETQLADKPCWTGWSERRRWHWMWNMHRCTEATLWDPTYQGLPSLLLLLPRQSKHIRLCRFQNVSHFYVVELIIWTSSTTEERTQTLQAPNRWWKPSITHKMLNNGRVCVRWDDINN